MEQISFIPSEMLNLIPHFGGDKRELNLFLRQCEYVIDKFKGDDAQNTYVMHAITGRLRDNAAALISGHDNIENWEQLKELLTQYYGDNRSEELIFMQLDNMKIEKHESYEDFYNRIQFIKSTLMSKVNKLTDTSVKQDRTAKINESSLNAFLYNLPLELVRTVRLSKPSTLEDALTIVKEEIKFYERYAAKNNWSDKEIRTIIRPPQKFVFGIPNQPYYRSGGPLFGSEAKQPCINNPIGQLFSSSQPQAVGPATAATGFGTATGFSTTTGFGTAPGFGTATGFGTANTAGTFGTTGTFGTISTSGPQSVGTGVSIFSSKQTSPAFGNPAGSVAGLSFGSTPSLSFGSAPSLSFGSAPKPEEVKDKLKEIECKTEVN